MFEKALFDYLEANFTTVGGKTVNWGYGEVAETYETPYIVCNVVDNNQDKVFLCEDFADSGDTLIDLLIYFPDKGNALYIKNQLQILIEGIEQVTDTVYNYNIVLNNHSPSGAAIKQNDMWVVPLTRTITYNRKVV